MNHFVIEAWSTDINRRVLLASTFASFCELRLPAGAGNTTSIHIIVQIRDALHCVAKFNLPPVTVMPDRKEIDKLINSLESTNITLDSGNPIIELLASNDPNTIGQVLTSVSQLINDLNSQGVNTAVSSTNI